MNKNKRMIGISILVVLMIIVIIVVAIKSKKETDVENPNIRYFDKGRSVDDIEWISVAEDGVSTCLVAYDFEPYYDVVPGKYILYYSAKGSTEFINVHVDDNYIYDYYKIYVYDMFTQEKRFLFDVTELMAENPDMQVVRRNYGCFIVEDQIIYQNVYEPRPSENIPYGQEVDKDYLHINVENGSYDIQEEKVTNWYTNTTNIFYKLEEDKLLFNNLSHEMLEKTSVLNLYALQIYYQYTFVPGKCQSKKKQPHRKVRLPSECTMLVL